MQFKYGQICPTLCQALFFFNTKTFFLQILTKFCKEGKLDGPHFSENKVTFYSEKNKYIYVIR